MEGFIDFSTPRSPSPQDLPLFTQAVKTMEELVSRK